MRKFISLLLFICSINILAAELPPAPQPEALQTAVDDFFAEHRKDKDFRSMSFWSRDLSAESSACECPFSCSSKDAKLAAVLKAFVTDEKNSYQYIHEVAGSGMLYSTNVGAESPRIVTRKSTDQEFYMLCAKNALNPRFRVMYAIAFVRKNIGGEEILEGTLFKVSSPRTDFSEEELNDAPKAQRYMLEGVFDDELRDDVTMIGLKCPEPGSRWQTGIWKERVFEGRFVYKTSLFKNTDILYSYVYKDGSKSPWRILEATPNTNVKVLFHKHDHEFIDMEALGTDDKKTGEKKAVDKAEETLKTYSVMLKSINDQIKELRKVKSSAPDYESVKNRLKKLHSQAEEITDKMQRLAEKVAKELE